MSIALTREELARSWLVEHYRRQGSPPMRTMLAVAVVVLGAAMVRRSPTPMAWMAVGWGAFLLLRPLFVAATLYFGRRDARPFEVTVDGTGVTIAGTRGSRHVPWTEITGWGLGRDYLWYEIRRASRATIPFRVIDDREGLEALFRDRSGRT